MAEADLELKYADLGKRDTPKRKANREHLQKMIDEIQAEQELKNPQPVASPQDMRRPLLIVVNNQRYWRGSE